VWVAVLGMILAGVLLILVPPGLIATGIRLLAS
jgi:hypothetical protein